MSILVKEAGVAGSDAVWCRGCEVRTIVVNGETQRISGRGGYSLILSAFEDSGISPSAQNSSNR